MTHLCEVCQTNKRVTQHKSALGTFDVCYTCNLLLDNTLEYEFLAEEDIPTNIKNEFVPFWCGGWQSSSHKTFNNEIRIYLSSEARDKLHYMNIFKFCRQCFIEYLNDGKG